MEDLYRKDCVRMMSGKYVNVFEPDPDTILIEDIAHGLSRIGRFGGQTRFLYTVAQHSIMVKRQLAKKDWLAGLLHDATEAYMMDVPGPIKNRLAEYKRVEERLCEVIFKKFGVGDYDAEAVKAADKLMMEWEWKEIVLRDLSGDLFENAKGFYPGDIKIYSGDLIIMKPEYAKEVFLECFWNLKELEREEGGKLESGEELERGRGVRKLESWEVGKLERW